MNLLDVPDSHVAQCRVHPCGRDLQELLQGQSWAVVEHRATRQLETLPPLKMALLADVLTQCDGLEVGWIDNGQVLAVDRLRTTDMELAGPVTSFAADRQSVEDGASVPGAWSKRLVWQNRQPGVISRSKCQLRSR